MKRLSEPEPRCLQDCEEACGKLLRVQILEGFVVAVFPFAAISVPVELEAKLRELVGRRVGIIRLDGEYRMRAL